MFFSDGRLRKLENKPMDKGVSDEVYSIRSSKENEIQGE